MQRLFVSQLFPRRNLTIAGLLSLGFWSAAATAGDEPNVSSRSLDEVLAASLSDDAAADAPVGDALFIRRASLDLAGRLPSAEEARAFEADRDPAKREKLIDRLLADREAYATHWLTFWNDALRNAYRGTGFIDSGRAQITEWLFAALYHNRPYNEFVHELISPVPGSDGFTRGIKWRGVVNESQRPEIQAAQNIAQVFLATNLKCASCHDSFVNSWKLADAYRLASVFAEQPLEIHHCDQPTGEQSEVGFIYPELGAIDPSKARADRMAQLADLVVSRENERFARTIVNRLWAQLMGRGIVEPRDNLDASSEAPELLQWLADDFVAHGYDLKHTLRVIATSKAYQLPAVDSGGVDDDASDDPPDETEESAGFRFRGPLIKRMTAEQFADAVSAVTGEWERAGDGGFRIDGRGQAGQLAAACKSLQEELPADVRNSPIDDSTAAALLSRASWMAIEGAARGKRTSLEGYFRAELVHAKGGGRAIAVVDGAGAWEFFVDGVSLAIGNEHTPAIVDLQPYFRKDRVMLGMHVTVAEGSQPAFRIATANVRNSLELPETSFVQGEWKGNGTGPKGWQKQGFDDGAWIAVAPLAELPKSLQTGSTAPMGPFQWTVDAHLTWGDRPVRAPLSLGNTLQASLGRPNREQVVTLRDSKATLLQALELTNGETLDRILRAGAERLVKSGRAPEDVVASIYRSALGRAPDDPEQTLAAEVLGPAPTVDEYSDFLWMIVMLPEFQLVY